MTATSYCGACHCGNIHLEFETGMPVSDWPLRGCACGFCTRHGARYTSDPKGRLRIAVKDADALTRYRHGTESTDFLLCGRCGVYVGTVFDDEGELLSVVNVNVLDCAGEVTHEMAALDHSARSGEDRRARWRKVWTPAELTL